MPAWRLEERRKQQEKQEKQEKQEIPAWMKRGFPFRLPDAGGMLNASVPRTWKVPSCSRFRSGQSPSAAFRR